MNDGNSHVSDQDLLSLVDGELSRSHVAEVHRHLEACWNCRARMQQIEGSIADFVRAYRDNLDPQLPPAHVSRAMLKARLSELAARQPQSVWRRAVQSVAIPRRVAYLSGAIAVMLITLIVWQSPRSTLALSPDPQLTPGAALPLTEADLCSREPASESRLVLASVGKRVFEEYGIRNPQPRRYELDYLIDPDLGGSDDTRNLWPQPYSATWNARVKDALENHLRELVCAGAISLAQAQQDISMDWISAYKKYFQTDQPIEDHLAFVKDQPWQ